MKLKITVFLIVLVLAGNVLKIFISDNIKTKVEIDESGLSMKQKKDSQDYNKIDINKSEYEEIYNRDVRVGLDRHRLQPAPGDFQNGS